MKRLISIIALLAIVFVAGPVWAADLEWDYPTDWAEVDGWIVYYNEVDDVDDPYVVPITKADVTEDGVEVLYQGFEVTEKLNLEPGVSYNLWLTAYNLAATDQSGASNTVLVEGPALFEVPPTSKPQWTIYPIPGTPTGIAVMNND